MGFRAFDEFICQWNLLPVGALSNITTLDHVHLKCFNRKGTLCRIADGVAQRNFKLLGNQEWISKYKRERESECTRERVWVQDRVSERQRVCVTYK